MSFHDRVKLRSWRWLVAALGAGLIFGAGWAGGSGRLHIGDSTPVANQALPLDLDYNSVDELYDFIKKDFDGALNVDQLLDGLKKGLANSTGDPYTEYFNAQEAKSFDDALNGSFEGIGAELGKDGDSIIIISPLAGYPAEKAGLRAKDEIIKINTTPTAGMTIGQAVKLIRGPKDTKVKLTLIRGDQKPFEATIIRQQINIPSVTWSREGDVGYLKISQFGSDTVRLATQAAREFKDKKIKAVILDLRGNPGGYLAGAVDVSGLWLESGQKVVEERRGKTIVDEQLAYGSTLLKGLPTVVLIDEGSASASEIIAGALQDYKVATILGAKSFGKGSVQRVENLPGGAELKVTIARWYTPKGRSIDKTGITPDIVIKISEDDRSAERDSQKNKALEILRKQNP